MVGQLEHIKSDIHHTEMNVDKEVFIAQGLGKNGWEEIPSFLSSRMNAIDLGERDKNHVKLEKITAK